MHVIEVDGGYDGHVGMRDRRRIPRAAHADLNDGYVDGGISKDGIRQLDECLEEGHPRLPCRC